MARLNECILYRNFEHGEILDKMAELPGNRKHLI